MIPLDQKEGCSGVGNYPGPIIPFGRVYESKKTLFHHCWELYFPVLLMKAEKNPQRKVDTSLTETGGIHIEI